jgi:F-type H+-transporting ATPase subunit delta
MSAHSLATRYAKSLVGLASEKGQLDEACQNVKSINNILDSNRELKLLLKSPIISVDKKLQVAKQLFEGKTSEVIYKFIQLVIKKRREANLSEIFTQFVTQYNELKGITPVKLTTAVKLDGAFVEKIINALKAKEGLKQVELHEKVDESLVGGFILQYGDKMIDNSVSRNLRELTTLVEDNSYIKKYS